MKMTERRPAVLPLFLLSLSPFVVVANGCILQMGAYKNPTLRLRYEDEFRERPLDPIEGFWRSDNEFAEGVAVIYRIDPATNHGFPFAARTISVRPKRRLPYAPDFTRIGARLKPGKEAGIYYGQVLMVRGTHHFWNDVTVRLLDPTTAETTVHTSEPILGGSTQRSYLIGPDNVLKARLTVLARRRGDEPRLPDSSAGSGFLVTRDLVVTNFHVIERANTIRCVVRGGAIEGRLMAIDADNDLALLKLSGDVGRDVKPLELADPSEVRQGSRVFAMGYQLANVLGTKLSVHEGTVSSLTGFGGTSSQFQVEMNVHPGSSGGPLLDERGCVVGVVTSKLGLAYLLKTGDIPQGMMFAVKGNLIRALAAAAGVADEVGFSCSKRPAMALERITESFSSGVVRIEVMR